MNKISDTLNNLFYTNKDRIFVTDSKTQKTYTYEDFLALVTAYSKFLTENGVGIGDIVCYTAINAIESLALYIAVLTLNAKIALIDPLKGSDEVQNIVKRVLPKLTVTLEELKNIETQKTDKKEIDFDKIDYTKPFLITFTSGSTGEAKGVIHSFENLFLSAYDFGKRFDLNEKNVFLHNFPMAYMAGVLNTFIKPLIFGCQIVVAPRLSVVSAMSFWKDLIKNKVNTVWLNPTFVAMLLKLDRSQDGIEYAKKVNITAFCGTAPLDKKVKQDFENKYNVELFESYGLTETLFLTTNYPNQNKTASPGKLLESVNIKFNENSEISVKVPWLFLRYFGDSPNSKDDYFKTGDLGEINEDFLYITGRAKDIIIKGGVNISPKRISDFISDYFVSEFTILGLKDDTLGEKIACFHIDKIDEKEINSKILKELGKDFTIDSFYELDEIPKNINGKVDKLLLKKRFEK